MLKQWLVFGAAPVRLRAYILALGVAAVAAALLSPGPQLERDASAVVVALVLVVVAGFQVESARWLSLRFGYPLFSHAAIPAWALSCALLLPGWWLLMVVPVATSHACVRDPSTKRGLRWVPAVFEFVLCGVAAALLVDLVSQGLDHSGLGADGRNVVLVLVGVAGYFAGGIVLWFAARSLRIAGVRWWVRGRRLSCASLSSDLVALLTGAFLAVVLVLNLWLALFVIAASMVIQQARLVLPLRVRLATEGRLVAENEKLSALVDTLALRNSELDDLIRFRTDLMGMLGHEISNPLTSVLGFVEIGLAAATENDARSAEAALRTVERNAHKVADIVTDIRHLVASERGGITASPEGVVLEPRLRAAIDDRSRNRRPDFHCPADLSVRIQPGHLDQIMANLLSNAAKYAGGATEVSAVSSDGGPWVEVSVLDSGPGVSDQTRAHLFDRYWRDAEASQNVPGTGIGLYISRELARANGGDLVHENAAPTGSRFVLRIPRDIGQGHDAVPSTA